MGSRNLYDFNLAMLEKQSWNLLKIPESLVAQILKDKYYPMSAKFDRNQSYYTCSLRILLREVVRWNVDNGN